MQQQSSQGSPGLPAIAVRAEAQPNRQHRRSHDTASVAGSIAESIRSTEAIRVLRRPYLAGGYRPPPPVGNPAAWDVGTGLRMQRMPTHEETAYLQRKKQQEAPMFHLPNIERRYSVHLDDAAGQWLMPIRRTADLRRQDVHAQRLRTMGYGALSYGTVKQQLVPPRHRPRPSHEQQLEPALPDLSFRHRSTALPSGSALPPLMASVARAPPKAPPLALQEHGTLPLYQVPLSVSPITRRNLALLAS